MSSTLHIENSSTVLVYLETNKICYIYIILEKKNFGGSEIVHFHYYENKNREMFCSEEGKAHWRSTILVDIVLYLFFTLDHACSPQSFVWFLSYFFSFNFFFRRFYFYYFFTFKHQLFSKWYIYEFPITSLQIGLTLNFYFLKYLLQSYVNQHVVILFGRHSWNSRWLNQLPN